MEKFLYVTNTSSASFLGTFSRGEGLIEIYAALSTVVKPLLNFQLSTFNFLLHMP